MANTTLRTFYCPDDLWERAHRAARVLSVKQDKNVSVSDLIRRGLERETEEGEQ